MANITKIGDRKYKVRISKQSTKQRKFYNFTFRGTLAEARAFARTKETEIDSGFIPQSRLTFKEYFDMWCIAIRPTLSPRTWDGYEGYIKRYALASLQGLPLAEIRNHHIQKIYLAMDKSPTTVRNLHASLRACFSYAKKRDYIKVNPCKNVDLPAKRRKPIVVFTEGDAAEFVHAAQSMPNGLIFEFALETGMRPEEYLALRWRDISGNEVSVVQAVQHYRTGGGYYFKDIKTPKGRRRIPISDNLRQRLLTHRRLQNEHRMKIRTSWSNNDLVFPNEIGNPFGLPNIHRRYFTPILDSAFPSIGDLPHPSRVGITLYSLRHTCATLLLMAGENPKVVADRLGHSSVTITLDTYSHVLPHIQERATNVLDNILRFKKA